MNTYTLYIVPIEAGHNNIEHKVSLNFVLVPPQEASLSESKYLGILRCKENKIVYCLQRDPIF